ncbi:MAG: hypothetical protein R3Y08_07780 [Rikenellaceae bacterium]
MKNKLYLLGILTVMLITSCTKADEGLDNAANAGWATDSTMNSAGEYVISVGDEIVFTDTSENTLTHSWIIEDGCSFAATSGSESSNPVETVKFNEAGFYKVTLYNTYASDVSDAKNSITAKQDGDVWVIEQNFWVNVYGDLDAALLVVRVMTTGETQVIADLESGYQVPDDQELWTKATINTGDRIVFIDEADGGADSWYINYDGMSVAGTKGSVNILFSQPTTYSDFEYEVSRTNPASQIIKEVPIIVEVIEYVIPDEPDVPEAVNVIPEDKLSLYDYELAYSGNYWTTDNKHPADNFEISTEKAASGSQSLKVTGGNTALKSFMMNGTHAFDVAAGLYTLSFQIYLDSEGLVGQSFSIAHHLTAGWMPLNDQTGSTATYTFPEESGKWVTVEKVLKIEDGDLNGGQFKFRFDLLADTPAGTLYFDDIKLCTYTEGSTGGGETGACVFSDAEIALYGFDNVYSNNYWTANTTGLYYSLVTDTVAAGTGALKFAHEDEITADDGVVAYMLNGNAADQYVLLSTGKYLLQYQVYVADNGAETTDKTYIIDYKCGATGAVTWSYCLDPDTTQTAECIIPTTKGEWVTEERVLYLDTATLFSSKFVLRLTMPAGTPAGTEIYFDDFKLYSIN